MSFSSIWLPHQQIHSVGRMANVDLLRGDLARGPMWTDDNQKPGDLALSPTQILPAGDYCALLQLFHRSPVGVRAGSLRAEDAHGTLLGVTEIHTSDIEAGGWQREVVNFRLSVPTQVRIRFQYDQPIRIWTGLIRLNAGGPRPIFIIGHNKNTLAHADESVAQGANALEVDVSYRNGHMLAAETPPLPGWMQTSELSDWLKNAVKHPLAFVYFDCKMTHVPDQDFHRFGVELAAKVKAAGIPPERCLFSVGDPSAAALFEGVAAGGYGAAGRSMDGLHTSHPDEVAPNFWAQTAAANRLDVVGTGRSNLEFYKLLNHWWPPIQATVAARDHGQLPKKVVHWTLQAKENMRKMLDLGVDGIITDEEADLSAILLEQPYRQLCRKAKPSDWFPIRAHGV